MDKITHEVWLASWKAIVEQCNNRPQGTTVKQWLADNDINKKTYYYWLRRIRREVYSQHNSGLFSTAEQDKPAGSFVEVPIKDASNRALDPFKADAVLHSGSLVIGISNSISDRLLERLLEAADHAR